MIKIRYEILCEIFENENANKELLIRHTASIPLDPNRERNDKSTSRIKGEIKAIMRQKGVHKLKTEKSEIQKKVEKDLKSKLVRIFRDFSVQSDVDKGKNKRRASSLRPNLRKQLTI